MNVGVSPAAETSGASAQHADSRVQRLEQLFGEHGRAVFAFARRRATPADADDVVAETFAVAWRRLDDVPAHARPWLLAVARNCLSNRQRSERRVTALRGRLALVREQEAETPADPSFTDSVRVAFTALPPDAREVLALLAWDGLSPADAAAVLGCTRAAFYLRLQRARRRFATELGRFTHQQKEQ